MQKITKVRSTLKMSFNLHRYWKCDIKGAPDGILKGKKIAIKDNCCVAGVPMCIGSTILEGYTPEVDATIVTRILDAGNVSILHQKESSFIL